MNPNKIYNEQMKIWYKSDLERIINELQNKDWVSTSYFEGVFSDGKRNFGFVGKSNRPHLRKCLRTLEAENLIECKNIGANYYHWRITEKGKLKSKGINVTLVTKKDIN